MFKSIVKVCLHLLNSEHKSKLSTPNSSGERWYEIDAVRFAEMTGDRY